MIRRTFDTWKRRELSPKVTVIGNTALVLSNNYKHVEGTVIRSENRVGHRDANHDVPETGNDSEEIFEHAFQFKSVRDDLAS